MSNIKFIITLTACFIFIGLSVFLSYSPVKNQLITIGFIVLVAIIILGEIGILILRIKSSTDKKINDRVFSGKVD